MLIAHYFCDLSYYIQFIISLMSAVRRLTAAFQRRTLLNFHFGFAFAA